MNYSGNKSSPGWDKKWRASLKKGKCPYGCEVKTKTCGHLEKYLQMTGAPTIMEPPVHYTDDIEKFADLNGDPGPHAVVGTWSLYKKLKAFGLMNDDILMVIDKHVLKKTFRTIVIERHWTSYSALYRRYRWVMEQLKKKGFGGTK